MEASKVNDLGPSFCFNPPAGPPTPTYPIPLLPLSTPMPLRPPPFLPTPISPSLPLRAQTLFPIPPVLTPRILLAVGGMRTGVHLRGVDFKHFKTKKR